MKKILNKIILWSLLFVTLCGSGWLMNPYRFASSFSPSDISNLVGWWDATDVSTITFNGDDVSQIDDLSGQDNHMAQSTASEQPERLVSVDLNNQNVLDFDGITEYMSGTFASATTQPYFLVVVVRTELVTSVLDVIVGTFDGSRPFLGVGESGGNDELRMNADDTEIAGLSGAHPYESVISVRFNDTTGEIWQDGVSIATGSTVGTAVITTAGLILANFSGLNREFNGKMPETLVYDKDITTAEHNNIGNYLADKYGLTWNDIT